VRCFGALLALAAAVALWAAVSEAKPCDDYVDGKPPITFFDRVRWDIGVRGEAPFDPSFGGRAAAEYSFKPNVDFGFRLDYGYQRGGLQTIVVSGEARVYPWMTAGGTGANDCGYKVRTWTTHSGVPYFMISGGGGANVAPHVGGAWNARLGAGWEWVLDRKRALFLEIGGAVGAMNGAFGSAGLRW
jgi:hypothetical protein